MVRTKQVFRFDDPDATISSMLSVIYFDLGGVLFRDFYSGAEGPMVKLLGLPRERILQAYEKTDVPDYCTGSMDEQTRWKLFTDELGLPEERIEECIEVYYQSFWPISETKTFVQELRNNYPQLRLGVLSDQPIRAAQTVRKEHQNLFSLFEPKLTLISCEVGLTKRDEHLRFFKEAIRKAGKPAGEILFVDNSESNIDAAELLGIKGFLFDSKRKDLETLISELKQEIEQI
jgi:FMN phosphatase YigB (HAD superfamily)